MHLSDEQVVRYSRQIVISEVGPKGQKKIREGKVLIVGAGGLGSPAAYYLAAAGVGTLGIIDGDAVDLSNLQRQILHFTGDVGRPKVESASEKLKSLNPECNVVAYRERISAGNALDIIKNYDVVVDATDNFPSRFLTNDACLMAGKPFIYGGVLKFFGQVLTVVPGDGPCFRCIFGEPPPAGSVPTCSQTGVLGVLPGVIGVIQATEVLKYLLRIGDLLVGRLLTYDALSMQFREIGVKKDPGCAVCGENPVITGLIDYEKQDCETR
ncbi:MAG TPA: molybdopterin-synthase adenylyltransferase MoeB [Bacillota bacterium]|nr:molybdopterin-synthase adenylyltransferase MoeB [Bacillota bacterium]